MVDGSSGTPPTSHAQSDGAPLSTLAMAMFFGSLVFCTAALAARQFLGDVRGMSLWNITPATTPTLQLESLPSVFDLLWNFSILGIILLYAHLCEHHPPFPHADKTYDRDSFLFLVALFFVLATLSSRSGRPNSRKEEDLDDDVDDRTAATGMDTLTHDGSVLTRTQHYTSTNNLTENNTFTMATATAVLPRSQTEEWKGWMSYVLLMGHYYEASEFKFMGVVLVAAYVWMTTLGHASYFYTTRDFGLTRLLHVLWRYNFLVVLLALSQGTSYILYSACLRHSYFFLVVYLTLRCVPHANGSKRGMRVKLVVLAVIFFLVWDVEVLHLFSLLHGWFLSSSTPTAGAPQGSLWAWYVESSTHHWSAYLGLLFGLNLPIYSLWLAKLEAQPRFQQYASKAVVGMALVVACRFGGQWQGNAAYGSVIPILTYVYFRNLTHALRGTYCHVLQHFGQISLETYLLHYHIWLTSNGTTLLVWVPGWPKVNLLIVTLVFYGVCRQLHHLTLHLRKVLLPIQHPRVCVRNVALLGGVLGGFYVLALALNSLGLLHLKTVAGVAMVGGMLLYQFVMDVTSSESQQPISPASTSSPHVVDKKTTTTTTTVIGAVTPHLIGAMVVLILGLTWHGMAQSGAGKIQKLPATCDAFVNDGMWVPVDACNAEARGAAARDHGLANFATCNPASQTYVWGWNQTRPSTHCRFSHRSPRDLGTTLRGRTITFVGDSIVRHTFHAMARQMGLAEAGAYNAKLPKWSDMVHRVEDHDATVQFYWAALATDQVAKLQELLKKDEHPDLLVVGGGPWDRLHVYATDEDRESHRATVRALANELKLARSAGIPVAWIVPTTINTPALLTQEKQDNIKETDMEAMRALYLSLGVLDAASFVLDGPAFTTGRVTESYDGVHYPLSVYNAGAQILANAMDWLLVGESSAKEEFVPPRFGSMAHPWLGIVLLFWVLAGVVLFDGFLGFSYLASIFVQRVMPRELYDEAFSLLQERHTSSDAPSGNFSSAISKGGTTARSVKTSRSEESCAGASGQSSVDEEIAALLGGSGRKFELSSITS